MVVLKKKIKIIPSLPDEKKEKFSIVGFIITIIFLGMLGVGGYFAYKYFLPYINAVDINRIAGKRVLLTDCNTLDYVIISQDKSYSLQLTNDKCEKEYFEGSITVKNNEIIFNDQIKGIIDSSNNIVINSKMFINEEEKSSNEI